MSKPGITFLAVAVNFIVYCTADRDKLTGAVKKSRSIHACNTVYAIEYLAIRGCSKFSLTSLEGVGDLGVGLLRVAIRLRYCLLLSAEILWQYGLQVWVKEGL